MKNSFITIFLLLFFSSCEKKQQSIELSSIWTIDNFTMDKGYRLICKNSSIDNDPIYIYGLLGYLYCGSNIIFKQYKPNSIDFNYVVIDTSLCEYKFHETRSKIYCNDYSDTVKLRGIDYKEINDLIEGLGGNPAPAKEK